MIDRHLPVPRILPVLRVLGGLLFLGLIAAGWATVSGAGVAIVAVGLLTAGAAVATAVRLPLPSAVRRMPGLAAVASLALTACYQGPVVNATGWWWAVETCALLALLGPMVRRMKRRAGAVACVLVHGAAIAVLPLRLGPHMTPPSAPAETGVLCLFWALLAAGAAALGGYLRGQDAQRRRALADQAREQRLEVARDLHDFASHDVMGVVVLVQAARLLAREEPDRALALLPRIEEAGMHAMAAMDRTVWTLNGEGEASGSGDVTAQPPGGPPRTEHVVPSRDRRRDLSELPALTARFTRTGTTSAHLDVPEGTLQELPAEVSATGYRVVMESLTNVRRHAPAAVAVRIAAERVPYGGGTALRLTVTDSAEAGGRIFPRPERAQGGLGLAGLTDRVEALGGVLTAGPHGSAGWQVRATLPLPEKSVV
ncbi:histidine kinase [Streptomyces sp. RY43-2]|uniref:histidine kinase n=1 Tax=Streptomyces macrolidinus TaxID=2952607 RepID=A0ABT0ZJD5_9ACTN|nr:histidine kinase [Streptomyces macrolidinus]MCN9243699.1 histidine kinase [Streptomyces macrolidinus]